MKIRSLFLSVFCFFCGTFLLFAQKGVTPLYKQANAPLEQRVQDLLQRMTLEEKCRQIDIWHPKSDLSISEEMKKEITSLGDTVKNGIGFLQFKTEMNQAVYAARFNAVQKYFVEQTRLGIPAISNGEGCSLLLHCWEVPGIPNWLRVYLAL
jgi:beta-glucosidase